MNNSHTPTQIVGYLWPSGRMDHGLPVGAGPADVEVAQRCKPMVIATAPVMAADALLAGLQEALELVESFHGPIEWETYRDFSPEMKRLRAIVARATGSAS